MRLLVLLLSLASFPAISAQYSELSFRYNEMTSVSITNQPCSITEYAETYPMLAYARNEVEGDLLGCYAPFVKDKSSVVIIHWADLTTKDGVFHKGDFSMFPSERFLEK